MWFRIARTPKCPPARRGPRPFSRATQRRVLADLTARALAGEVPAMEALLRLNYDYGSEADAGGSLENALSG